MTVNADPTLASRYIADQLSEAERRDYEARLLSDPDTVAELEATARLKVGLAHLREAGALEELLRKPFLPAYTLPLAASILAIAVSMWLWWPNPSGSGMNPLLFTSPTALTNKAGHPLPVALTVALFNRRATTPTVVATKPASPGAVALRVLPTDSNKAHRYRLTLLRQRESDFEKLTEIDDLMPAEDGFVQVYADADRLRPGHYQVVVTDQTVSTGTPAETLKFDWINR
jgi:hypothetical protein